MSWDIFVQDLPAGISSVVEIPANFEPGPIGQRSEIIAKLSALYPECNFADPSCGTLELPGCSIEFNLGSGNKLQSFAMHVRGDERAPVVVGHPPRVKDGKKKSPAGTISLLPLSPHERTSCDQLSAVCHCRLNYRSKYCACSINVLSEGVQCGGWPSPSPRRR